MQSSTNREYSSLLLDSTASRVLLSNEEEDSFSIFVSTWGGQIYLLKFEKNEKEIVRYKTYDFSQNSFNPILGLCTSSRNKLYFSNNDEISQSVIRELDLHSMKVSSSEIGSHKNVINSLFSIDDDTLCSFSWDKTCKLWDIRSDLRKPIKTIELNAVPTAVKMKDDHILGVLDSKEYFYLDSLKTSEPYFFESDKSYEPHISSIDVLEIEKDKVDFVIGTIDGKIEHIKYQVSKGQKAKASGAWKSHKTTFKNRSVVNRPVVFSVNSLFSLPGNLLISGGDDGNVHVNDVAQSAKKKVLLSDSLPVKHVATTEEIDFLVVSKGYGMHQNKENIISQGASKAKIIVSKIEDDDLPLD